MIHLHDTAFVIKRTNFSDSDKYITLFTRNHGKQEVVAKGVRKITSKKAPHLELLNEIKFHAVKTRKNFIVTDTEVVNTFSEVKDNHIQIGLVFLVCELIDKLCPVDQRHEDIYQLIQSTMKGLSENKNSKHITDFEIRILTLLGFWDNKKKVNSVQELEHYIETITERKIKSRSYLKF